MNYEHKTRRAWTYGVATCLVTAAMLGVLANQFFSPDRNSPLGYVLGLGIGIASILMGRWEFARIMSTPEA